MPLHFPKILIGNCLEELRNLPHQSVHAIFCSPPYWGHRAYAGASPVQWPAVNLRLLGYQPVWFAPTPRMPVVSLPPAEVLTIPAMLRSLGEEEDVRCFIAHLVLIMREAKRVLRDDGVLFINLGESSMAMKTGNTGSHSTLAGIDLKTGKQKATNKTQEDSVARITKRGLKFGNIAQVPSLLAASMVADGWMHRKTLLWHKPNPKPEPHRKTWTSAYEPILMFTKGIGKRCTDYYFDQLGMQEPGETEAIRNPRDILEIPVANSKANHEAVCNSALPARLIKVVTSERGCCPFCGAQWERRKDNPDAWKPACSCPAHKPIPCTVLDCFGGSGSTGTAAYWLGRKSILIDISAKNRTVMRKQVRRQPSWYDPAERNMTLQQRREKAVQANLNHLAKKLQQFGETHGFKVDVKWNHKKPNP